MSNILNTDLSETRKTIAGLVAHLRELADVIGHDELRVAITDIEMRLNDPFMFVIVGEVKAGKSSFINALLDTGQDICKVGVAPVTDSIQEIIYGHPAREEVVNPYFKVIHQPVEILKDIAIVDTPGTNTIIQHHQELTERFVPSSDLIVFVFEAKNPYRQSAWEFFEFIHEDWRKKVIFILQQKDLMPDDDLQVNMEGLRQHAEKKGLDDPVVFAVSAKQELEGDHDNSGFEDVRAFIRDHITGGRQLILKLESHLNTIANLSGRITDAIALRRRQYESDVRFRQDITESLSQQKYHAKRQADMLVENVVASYQSITDEKAKKLHAGLAFFKVLRRTINSMFDKNASIRKWLEEFLNDLESDFQERLRIKLNDSVLELAESIQQMATILDLKIRQSETILKQRDDIFSDIAERRSQVMRELRQEFETFLNNTESFKDSDLFPQTESMSPNLAAGSGIAIVGVILTAVTSGMVFDITGGILTAVGVIFAGISLGVQRSRLVRKFRQEMAKGRDQLEESLGSDLKLYVDRVAEKMEANFSSFDQMLSEEKTAIEELEGKIKAIDQEASSQMEYVHKLKRDAESSSSAQSSEN